MNEDKKVKYLFRTGIIFLIAGAIFFGVYLIETANKDFSSLFKYSKPVKTNVDVSDRGEILGLNTYLNQADNINNKNKQGEKDWNIEIPSIDITAPIITEVNGENEEEYLTALKSGVAHLKGTYLPGIEGNTFIFGHSSNYWWDDGNYKDIFANLGEVHVDEKIFISSNYKKYIYEVYDKKIVNSGDVSITKKLSDKDTLVLMTCYPTGTTNLRLVIFAKKVN